MSDGALKPEKDFSKEADKQIPEAEELAKVHSPGFRDVIEMPFGSANSGIPNRPTSKRRLRSSRASKSKRAR
jgi:hypothetical protein